jgi:hypothetical protein
MNNIAKVQTSNIVDHDDETIQDSDAAHDRKCTLRLPGHCDNPQPERPVTIDRNGQFHSLSSEEREHPDCVEYQAVRLLSYVVPTYIIVWQFFGCVAIGAYMACNERVAATANAVNPWYVSRHLHRHYSDDFGQVGRCILCRCWVQQCRNVVVGLECGKSVPDILIISY